MKHIVFSAALLLSSAIMHSMDKEPSNNSTQPQKIARLLEYKDNNGNTFLHNVIKQENSLDDLVLMNDKLNLLNKKKDNEVDSVEETIVEEATEEMQRQCKSFGITNVADYVITARKNIEITVGNLIFLGVDINIQNNNGATALYLAIQNRKEEIVKILLAANADPNIASKKGITPLQLAFSLENNGPIINMLLVHKAHVEELLVPQKNIKEQAGAPFIYTMIPVNVAVVTTFLKNLSVYDQDRIARNVQNMIALRATEKPTKKDEEKKKKLTKNTSSDADGTSSEGNEADEDHV